MRINKQFAAGRRRKLVGGVAVTFGIALIMSSVASSGAYFTDKADGNVSGTVGSIRIDTTTSSDLVFNNMLPGELQAQSVTYKNTGSSPQDVWLVFPNVTALSALNNLGTYGEVHVANNGTALFDSANLNDRATTCGAFAPTGCWPLPQKIKLVENLAAGQSSTLKVSFAYAGKLSTQAPVGTLAVFNTYPVTGQTTIHADEAGSGLPFQLVALQHGQMP